MNNQITRVVVLLLCCFYTFDNGIDAWIIDPGPLVIATKGEVWPKPQTQTKLENYYVITPVDFHFNIISEYCSILQEAIVRYTQIILKEKQVAQKYSNNETEAQITDEFVGYLETLDISLTQPCIGNEYPHLYMDENYTLTIPPSTESRALLQSNSIWGILRGLETFSQLIYTYTNDASLYINATSIQDFPRFPHRGLLIDTSRHYQPMDIIYKNLDAMTYNKMNVFHWHIVDDESFPFASTKYPELSKKGAYHPEYMIYTPTDVKAVIEYARLRGIRVVAEFDTPGHTRSWGVGVPELLSACYKNGIETGQYGPMDPSREFVFSFLDDLYNEINQIFPDEYKHLGGDEVPFDCWEGNTNINNFMSNMNISNDYTALQRYFMERLLNITSNDDIAPIVWEEVFNTGTTLPNNTVVQVWYSGVSLLKEIITMGYRALYSSCWYLDHLAIGGDWKKFYSCEPANAFVPDNQFKFILGGEACMWGEVVDEQNVLQRIWPRASAAAEKLWSAYYADTVDYATRRLEEHACRLIKRDVPAQPPNGAGFCLS